MNKKFFNTFILFSFLFSSSFGVVIKNDSGIEKDITEETKITTSDNISITLTPENVLDLQSNKINSILCSEEFIQTESIKLENVTIKDLENILLLIKIKKTVSTDKFYSYLKRFSIEFLKNT